MNIIIVEDDRATRNRISSLLHGQNDYTVSHAVTSAEEAVAILQTERPEIIILDLGLPGLSNEEAIREIKRTCPSAEILVFTVMEEDEHVFAALKEGASGYILKDAQPMQIIEAIEELKKNGAPMSFSIARKVLNEFRSIPTIKHDHHIYCSLSSRESEILGYLYQGDCYKEIADKLCISIHTVHTHIKNIYSKLQVNSRAQAVYEAFRKKLI